MCSGPGDRVEEGSKGDADDSSTGGVNSEAIVFYDGSDVLFYCAAKN